MNREEAAAFADFYGDHVWSVYGFFGYRLTSRQEAEDLTQATFEKALRAWRTYDERRGPVGPWLMTIARNTLIDHHRRDRAGTERPLDDRAAGEGSLGITEAPEPLGLSPELESALTQLEERERELIALRFGADLTGPQIAKLTGLTLANVQQILSRSLRRLRAELEATADDRPRASARAEGADPGEADSGDRE